MNKLSAELALQILLEGNTRFVEGKELHSAQSVEKLGDLQAGQAPIAIVVGCYDCRVSSSSSPEIIFDQGLGYLFVIRIARSDIDGRGPGPDNKKV